MFKKENLTFSEVIELLKLGHKVKVPEWAGFWELEKGKIMAHCKDGDVVEATHFQVNVFRSDWQVAD